MGVTYQNGWGNSKARSRKDIIEACRPYVNKWRKAGTEFAYISLAGYQFIDSDLFHNELGIPYELMASAENKMTGWAEFSKPSRDMMLARDFASIDMTRFKERMCQRIIWADGTQEMLTVEEELAHSVLKDMVKPGSLAFFTFTCCGRTAHTNDKQAQNKMMDELFDGRTDTDYIKLFANKCNEIIKTVGYGMKIIYSSTYRTGKGRAFVVGFEVTPMVGLNDTNLCFTRYEDADTGAIHQLTHREKERLAMVLKYWFKDSKVPRWDTLDAIPHDEINTPEIRGIRNTLTSDDEARIMKDFPDRFRNFVPMSQPEPSEEPVDDEHNMDYRHRHVKSVCTQLRKHNFKDDREKVDEIEYILEQVMESMANEDSDIMVLQRVTLIRRLFGGLKDTLEGCGGLIKNEKIKAILTSYISEFKDEIIGFLDQIPQVPDAEAGASQSSLEKVVEETIVDNLIAEVNNTVSDACVNEKEVLDFEALPNLNWETTSSIKKPSDIASTASWADIIASTLVRMGGQGRLKNIYEKMATTPEGMSKISAMKSRVSTSDFTDTVRYVIRTSPRFKSISRGHYALTNPSEERFPSEMVPATEYIEATNGDSVEVDKSFRLESANRVTLSRARLRIMGLKDKMELDFDFIDSDGEVVPFRAKLRPLRGPKGGLGIDFPKDIVHNFDLKMDDGVHLRFIVPQVKGQSSVEEFAEGFDGKESTSQYNTETMRKRRRSKCRRDGKDTKWIERKRSASENRKVGRPPKAITKMKNEILSIIKTEPGITQRMIAKKLGIAHSTVCKSISKIPKKMIKRNKVNREWVYEVINESMMKL